MIFSISNDLAKANKITESTFTGLNIWERRHIEVWVRTYPEMLGEDLLVVSIQFDRFTNSSDRLDVLALDRAGNLVVIEIKRDSVAGFSDLQAIRYAAMVSSMTIEDLLTYYVDYRRKYYDELPSEGQAIDQIMDFVESDTFEELSNRPRVILCSEDFSREITTTVLWLRESDIDITCVKITPYKIDEKIVIVPKVVIPLEEAKQYLIDVKLKEETKDKSQRKKYGPKSLRILIENRLVTEGDEIFLKNALPPHLEYEDGNPMFNAVITGKLGQSDGIKWSSDEKEYSISALTWKIFRQTHPEFKDPGGVNGNRHWVNAAGKPLRELAKEFLAEDS